MSPLARVPSLQGCSCKPWPHQLVSRRACKQRTAFTSCGCCMQEAPEVAKGATLLSHLREQADAGTEAVLGMSPADDAAVVILQRLGFPRSRHRTQVCFAECVGAADCTQSRI